MAYFQALEFAEDPPLTDELARLWAAVRKIGEQSIKWDGDGDEYSRTRVVDNCRRLMPEIKRSIVTVQKTTEKLDEVRVRLGYFSIFIFYEHHFVCVCVCVAQQELNSAHRALDASNLREQIIQESNDNLLAQIKTLKNELDAKTKQMEEEGL